jgi:hypothetical protein
MKSPVVDSTFLVGGVAFVVAFAAGIVALPAGAGPTAGTLMFSLTLPLTFSGATLAVQATINRRTNATIQDLIMHLIMLDSPGAVPVG